MKLNFEAGGGLLFLHRRPLSPVREQMLQPSPEPGTELLTQALSPFLVGPPPLDPSVLTPASLAASQALWVAIRTLNH